MPRVNVNTLLLIVGIGVAWYLYRKVSGALEAPANVIADTWFRLTAPSAAQAVGRVRLPDGSTIAIQEIVNAGGGIDGRGFFTWRNVGYQITGRDNSVYVARRLVS